MSGGRGRSHRGLVASVCIAGAVCLYAASPARAECVLEGHVGGFTVRTSAGRHVRVEEPRPVRLTPLRRGVFNLRADESSPLEGVIFEALPLFIGAEEIAVEGELVVLAAGTPLGRADHVRDDRLRVEASLGAGVRLVRAWVPCAAVRVGAPAGPDAEAQPDQAGSAPAPDLGADRPPTGAPWHARTQRVSLFPGPDAGLHLVRLHRSETASLRFTEVRRASGFVYVRAQSATGTRLGGWMHASDLRPAPRSAGD